MVLLLKKTIARHSRIIFFTIQMGMALGVLFSISGCSTIKEKLSDLSTAPTFNFSLPNKEASQGKATEFQAKYKGVLDDMLAFQDDPDLDKIEEKRQKMVSDANSLASKFQDLANSMQSKLDATASTKTTGQATTNTSGVNVLNKKTIQDSASKFQSQYASMVDDMLAFADNPDYGKAEDKRQKLISEANLLASKFQDLANSLQPKQDRTAPGATAIQATTSASSINILNTKTFKDNASEFQTRYTNIVDDMLAFQDNPDLDKIEEKRQKLISEANGLAAKFQDLSNRLQSNSTTSATTIKNSPTK